MCYYRKRLFVRVYVCFYIKYYVIKNHIHDSKLCHNHDVSGLPIIEVVSAANVLSTVTRRNLFVN